MPTSIRVLSCGFAFALGVGMLLLGSAAAHATPTGQPGGGGGYSSAGYDRGPREMFTATCSNCGRDAQVPFRPTSGKPVYCSDCFRSIRGA